MRRSIPREADAPKMPVNRPIRMQKYDFAGKQYTVIYQQSKRGVLYFDCWDGPKNRIAERVTFEEALDACQLHSVNTRAKKSARRSVVKPTVTTNTLKKVHQQISSTLLDPLDNFLDFTAPCGLHDLGIDFGGGMW